MTSVAPRFNYILSSDGSGNPDGSGGGACIVESVAPKFKRKFVGFFGASTGNEAEIMAALLGFSIIQELRLKQELETPADENLERRFYPSVLWQTDSQYLIRTWNALQDSQAKTQNFPNLSMWEALLKNAANAKVTPVHVRARSGNRRNEACDHASRWIQRTGERLLLDYGEEKIGRLKNTVPDEAWNLVDLRELVTAFKERNFVIISKKIEELTHTLRHCLSLNT